MKTRTFLLLAVAFVCFILLISCTPVCATESFNAPELTSPGNWVFVSSTTPALEWTYPDDSCKPEGYRIELYKSPEYDPDVGGGTGNPSTTWYPGDPLEAHSVYKWRVMAINGTTLGPASAYRHFMTGPECSTDDLQSPIVTFPEDGDIVTSDSTFVYILYPEPCLPPGLQVHISKNPTFADVVPYYSTLPATAWKSGDLEDCTTYYIRAYANDDSHIGPPSDTISFFTNLNGLCPTPPQDALVSGTVWNDKCILPVGPLPSPLPEGCIDNGSGGAWADAYRAPGESGIPGVEVLIGNGDCPSCGLGTTLTDSNGFFIFPDLAAGKYCICINAEANASIIKPGMWTLVMSGHEGWTYRSFFLYDGAERTGQDFGWYHYQTYIPYEEPIVPTLVKCGSLNNQKDCEGYPWCVWYIDQNRIAGCHTR